MKNTVKTAALLLLALVFALGAFACNKKPSGEPDKTEAPAKDYDVDELARKIAEGCTFEDEYLALLEDRDFSLKTRNIDAALVDGPEGSKQAAIYASSSTPEMVVCIKAADEASAEKVLEAVKTLINDYATNYSTYGPEQVEKLESAVEVVRGRYVIVAVTAQNQAAETFINTVLE